MSMISVEIGENQIHEYASGISAGEVLENVYGKRYGAVAAVINGIERDTSFILDLDCIVEAV